MGNKMSLKDQMRANKRLVTRSIREMDRERAALEREQMKLQNDIKKMAKEGQMGAVRVMAKDLVRTKQHISKFYMMRSQLQGLSLKMQTMKTSHEMAMAMGKMTKAMKRMNKQMNVNSINKIMMEFERENAKADMTQEMMGDALDDAMDDGEAEEEEEKIMAQVLDEIGVSMTGDLLAAPTQAPVSAAAETESAARQPAAAEAEGAGGAEEDGAVDDLEARLNQLRRG
jgi:charged multivesicular body protein 2A